MNKTVFTSFTILCLLSTVFLMGLAFNIQTVKAEPRTIYVDDDNTAGPWDGTSDHPYQNITSGLEHALANDTVFVYNGTYYENIIIDKSISLVGENRETTIIDGDFYYETVVQVSANAVLLSGFTIQGGASFPGGGILLDRSKGSNITNNIIRLNYGALFCSSSNNTAISANIFQNGIYTGVTISRSENVTFTENTVNMITVIGLDMHQSEGNLFYHNNFINNTMHVRTSESTNNAWDNGYPSGGNYWSNYTGVDLYSSPYQNETGRDGIGDTPHVIDENNQDNYPLMYHGGFIPIHIDETLTNYSCPVGTALNFTYTLNSTMHVEIEICPEVDVDPINWFSNYDLYVKWDGTPPTKEDYDECSLSGAGEPDSCSRRGLPPGTYYFMVFHYSGPDWGTYNVTLTCFYPVHNIDTGLDYATIQEAIDAPETLDGHTILVDAGTYYEHVKVDKSLTLKGQNKLNTIIDADGNRDAVWVATDNVSISGFTIKHSEYLYSGIDIFSLQYPKPVTNVNISYNIIWYNYIGIFLQHFGRNNIISHNEVVYNTLTGIEVYEGSNSKIIGNNIRENAYGIRLYGSSNNTFSANNIFSNDECGIRLWSSGYNTLTTNTVTNNQYGIEMWNSHTCSVYGNNVTDNQQYGIRFEDCNNSTLSGNNVNNNQYGIQLENCSYSSLHANNVVENQHQGMAIHYSSNCSVYDNNIADNGEGIFLTESSSNIVTKNNIVNHSYHAGISIQLSNYNTVSVNNITNNVSGIQLSYNSSNNSIYGNNIINNHVGIWVYEVSNNKFYHNNFVDNTRQFYDYSWSIGGHPSINIWDDGYPSGGNYWSDYTGIDMYSGPYQNITSSDGIGDISYVVAENNKDTYPLMNSYGLLDEMRVLYYKLLEKYNDLLADYHNLNSTYYTLLSNYTELLGNYTSLQNSYDNLLADFDTLNISYGSLNSSYNNLQTDYDLLNFSYNDLNATYNELKTRLDATISELNNIQNLMYLFIATTVILIATTVYLAKRKPKIKP